MIATPKLPHLTPQEYLDWEQQQPVKHEYIKNKIYAMTGGTIFHNDIAINLTSATQRLNSLLNTNSMNSMTQ